MKGISNVPYWKMFRSIRPGQVSNEQSFVVLAAESFEVAESAFKKSFGELPVRVEELGVLCVILTDKIKESKLKDNRNELN